MRPLVARVTRDFDSGEDADMVLFAGDLVRCALDAWRAALARAGEGPCGRRVAGSSLNHGHRESGWLLATHAEETRLTVVQMMKHVEAEARGSGWSRRFGNVAV